MIGKTSTNWSRVPDLDSLLPASRSVKFPRQQRQTADVAASHFRREITVSSQRKQRMRILIPVRLQSSIFKEYLDISCLLTQFIGLQILKSNQLEREMKNKLLVRGNSGEWNDTRRQCNDTFSWRASNLIQQFLQIPAIHSFMFLILQKSGDHSLQAYHRIFHDRSKQKFEKSPTSNTSTCTLQTKNSSRQSHFVLFCRHRGARSSLLMEQVSKLQVVVPRT